MLENATNMSVPDLMDIDCLKVIQPPVVLQTKGWGEGSANVVAALMIPKHHQFWGLN